MGVPPNEWCLFHGKSHLEIDETWGYPHCRKPPYINIYCRSRCVLNIAMPIIWAFLSKKSPRPLCPRARVPSRSVGDPVTTSAKENVVLQKYHAVLIEPWQVFFATRFAMDRISRLDLHRRQLFYPPGISESAPAFLEFTSNAG